MKTSINRQRPAALERLDLDDRGRRALTALVTAFVDKVRDLVIEEASSVLDAAMQPRPQAAARMLRRPRHRTIVAGAVSSAFGIAVVDPARLNERVAQVANEYQLSPREARVLAAAVHGVPRARLAEHLRSNPSTIHTQVRMAIRKLGQPSLADAAWWVRQQAEQGAIDDTKSAPKRRTPRAASPRRSTR